MCSQLEISLQVMTAPTYIQDNNNKTVILISLKLCYLNYNFILIHRTSFLFELACKLIKKSHLHLAGNAMRLDGSCNSCYSYIGYNCTLKAHRHTYNFIHNKRTRRLLISIVVVFILKILLEYSFVCKKIYEYFIKLLPKEMTETLWAFLY